MVYPLLDGQGNVRLLTDSTGAVTLRRSYDEYGGVRAQSGTGSTTLGYTGERMGTSDTTL